MSVGLVNNTKIKVKGKKEEKERSISEVDFISTSDRLKEENLHRSKGVKSNLSTTYLGRTSIIKDNKISAEERFLISEQGYTTGKLLNSTKCQILLDTRASKSFMSKSHYLHCRSLHSLPKFASK